MSILEILWYIIAALGAGIGTVSTVIYRTHRHLFAIAIRCAVSEFALTFAADQAVRATVVTVAAMIQIGECIAQNAVTCRVAKTTSTGARQTTGTFMAVRTAIQVIVRFAPVLT